MISGPCVYIAPPACRASGCQRDCCQLFHRCLGVVRRLVARMLSACASRNGKAALKVHHDIAGTDWSEAIRAQDLISCRKPSNTLQVFAQHVQGQGGQARPRSTPGASPTCSGPLFEPMGSLDCHTSESLCRSPSRFAAMVCSPLARRTMMGSSSEAGRRY